jgi:hypothetical protein
MTIQYLSIKDAECAVSLMTLAEKIKVIQNHPRKILINFLGGSCCGKSTVAANLYAYIKKKEIQSYLIQEFVTRFWVNEDRTIGQYDQLLFAATVAREEYVCTQKYQVCVNDSPALLCLLYSYLRQKENADMLEIRSITVMLKNHWEYMRQKNITTINYILPFNPLLFSAENRYEKDVEAVKNVSESLKLLILDLEREGQSRFLTRISMDVGASMEDLFDSVVSCLLWELSQ